MHVIFANTGVQYVCEPLRGGRFTPADVERLFDHGVDRPVRTNQLHRE